MSSDCRRPPTASSSRSNVTDGILIAQLDGRAGYHFQRNTPHDEALAALRGVGAPPAIVRQVADAARERYLAEPASHWQDGDVARLLDIL